MILDADNWKEIGATLARNKTRTALTAFGIFWGTLMLALLWGGSQGLKGMLQSNFDGFATNSAIIMPSRTTMPYKGYQKGMAWSLNQTDVDNLRRAVPEFETITPVILSPSTIRRGSKVFATTISGVEPNYMDVITPIVVAGRFINAADLAGSAKVCVLGRNAATALFGSDDPLGQYVEADNVYYKVVGVVQQRSEMNFGGRLDDAMLLPASTMMRAYNLGQNINFISAVAQPGVSPTSLTDKIFRTLRANHPLHPDDKASMELFDISEMFGMVDNIFTGVDVLILFVGLSSLIAGIIGVGNIMWIIVKERTKEFGIRRALGAKPRALLGQILSESALLTLIAGVAGICSAVGILAITDKIVAAGSGAPLSYTFQLSFGSAMAIMAAFTILGAAAGAIPATKAMRIKPIEALNDK